MASKSHRPTGIGLLGAVEKVTASTDVSRMSNAVGKSTIAIYSRTPLLPLICAWLYHTEIVGLQQIRVTIKRKKTKTTRISIAVYGCASMGACASR